MIRRLLQRWACRCDCHGPGEELWTLGLHIVTVHRPDEMCCDRGVLERDRS